MFFQLAENELYISFSLGDSIYKWNGQKLNSAFSLRSLNDFTFHYTPTKKIGGGISITYSGAYSAGYVGMLYDPYRKLFYRILRQENLQINKDVGNVKHSVLVADLNGNFLAELEFYRGDYLFYSGFIHPKGLALAASKENDDELRFEIFDINKVLKK
jgi:hypothetical protein